MTITILKKAGLGYNQLVEFTESLKNRREREKR